MIVPVPQRMSFHDLLMRYLQKSERTVPELLRILRHKANAYEPDGFMLLECESQDSRYFGQFSIKPYGGEYGYSGKLEGFIDIPGMPMDLWSIVAIAPVESFNEFVRSTPVAFA